MPVRRWLKYWWVPSVPLVLAILLFVLAVISSITGTAYSWFKAYHSNNVREFVTLLISAAGWWLTFAGLLIAGKHALRGLTFQALLKLHEDEGDPKQKTAKRLVLQAKPPENFVGNIYSHVRKYVQSLSDEDKEKLDEARRQISHFWYRAARLTDIGILDSHEIFESVGPPDILEILEPLEAIRAESDNPEWQPRSWPPMKLFIAWYKQQKRQEIKQLRQAVPARLDLYKESKHQPVSSVEKAVSDSA